MTPCNAPAPWPDATNPGWANVCSLPGGHAGTHTAYRWHDPTAESFTF